MSRLPNYLVALALLVVSGCGSDGTTTPPATAPADGPDATTDAGADGPSPDSNAEGGEETGTDSAAQDGPNLDSAQDSLSVDALDAADDTTGDVAVEEAGEPDAMHDATTPDADAATWPGQTSVQLASGEDAVSSYLINASPAAWNIFWGESVPLGRHFATGNVSYHTAFRFQNVQVPPGAQVTSAHLSFYPTNEVDSSNNLWINVYAELAADSLPFDPSNYDSGRPDQRLKTTSFIDHWLVRCNAGCTDITEYDCPQRKLDCWDRNTLFTVPKDLRTLVQDVVELPGWAPGHALTILLINSATDQDGVKYTSSRSVTGYDPARGPQYAPRLDVSYTLP